MNYKDLSWNSSDLIACKNAASMVLDCYGVDALIALDNKCAFGSFDVSSLLNDMD